MAYVLADYYRVGDGVTWSDVYSFTTVYAKGGQPHQWHACDMLPLPWHVALPSNLDCLSAGFLTRTFCQWIVVQRVRRGRCCNGTGLTCFTGTAKTAVTFLLQPQVQSTRSASCSLLTWESPSTGLLSQVVRHQLHATSRSASEATDRSLWDAVPQHCTTS